MLEVDISWVNANYQRVLFHSVRSVSADRLREMVTPRRRLTLVCFLHQAWHDMLDQAMDMYGKLLDRSRKALVYDAALRREELYALEAGNIQPAHRLLRESFRTALDRPELEGLIGRFHARLTNTANHRRCRAHHG